MIFPGGGKSGGILFYPHETMKTTSFVDQFLGKCHISRCTRQGSCFPPSDAYEGKHPAANVLPYEPSLLSARCETLFGRFHSFT